MRAVGDSVKQIGDPIPRMVFHCSPKKNLVMVIRGGSGLGKTVMGRLLASKGIPAVRTDEYLVSLRENEGEGALDTPLYRMLREEVHSHRHNEMAGKIIGVGGVAEFCRDFAAHLPLEHDLLCIEGELFSNPELFKGLSRELKKRGVLVWTMERDNDGEE